MHTIRVVTRLAQNARRTDHASALISSEHCHSSRNNPYYTPRHIIYYCYSLPTFSYFFFIKKARRLLKVRHLEATSRQDLRIRNSNSSGMMTSQNGDYEADQLKIIILYFIVVPEKAFACVKSNIQNHENTTKH